MRAGFKSSKAVALAASVLALATTLWAQSVPQAGSPQTSANPTQASGPAAQPAPGTSPVGGDAAPSGSVQPGAAAASQSNTPPAGPAQAGAPGSQPAPGTSPVGGDTPPATTGKPPAPGTMPVGGDTPAAAVNPDKVIEPGSQKVNVKPGSIQDVNAVGNRDIGGRGVGNWYSTDYEIKMGKGYAMEIEKSTKFITDPVVVEYVNRIGQNIVKNSDCKVPFTIKVIDSDVINAMALPGGFFYVNSGLIMAADEEAELAGVMAHETAHVCAHHAARGQTKGYYAEIASIPIMILAQGSYAGLGVYEASQLVIPMGLLEFSREYEAEADWLGVQYMYRAGYDPQAFIQIFEKLDALEKHKPGTLAKVFADHPQTPDRIAHSEEEIATILPARPDYMVSTSEFDDVKARLARIENRRKLNDKSNPNAPTLRRTGGTNNDPNSTSGSSTGDDRPTLGRRD